MEGYKVFISDWDWGKGITIIKDDASCYLRFHINKEDMDVAHFTIVEVAPEVRRNGLCKAIWGKAEDVAKNLGCKLIIGYAQKENVCFNWYLKIGMRVDSEKDENGYYKLVKHFNHN